MSSSSTESGTSPPPTLDDDNELVKPVSELVKQATPGNPTRKSSKESAPLIIAAYRYGDPYHKRRVKVPAYITWQEFLTLLANRLEVRGHSQIATYDENGIEIVSVEDLLPNDVLVVKEKTATEYSRSNHFPRSRDERGHSTSLRQPEETPHAPTTAHAHVALSRNRLQSHFLPPAGTPLLTHFIKANHFGYYFLAEIDSQRLGGGREGGGRELGEEGGGRRRTHCVVKVPSCDKSSGELGGSGRDRGGGGVFLSIQHSKSTLLI